MFISYYTNSVNSTWSATTKLSNCKATNSLTDRTGTFSDGSGNNLYGSGDNCTWEISPGKGFRIIFTFLEYDINPLDQLLIYEGSYVLFNSSQQGTSNPGTVSSDNSGVYVVWITRTSNLANGWTLYYTSERRSLVITIVLLVLASCAILIIPFFALLARRIPRGEVEEPVVVETKTTTTAVPRTGHETSSDTSG